MSERLLILTAGTNPHAIASVLTRVKEIFDYNKVLILATSASKNDVEEAKGFIKGIIPNSKIVMNVDVDIMDTLFKESISEQDFYTSEKLRKKIEDACKNYKEIYVDVTGGTKLMSSITATITSSLKAESGETKVIGPCQNVSICIGYLTHMELATNASFWWSHRLHRGVGYYPKIPRILAVPWNVDAEQWSRCDSEKNFLDAPSSISLPYFQYGKTLEPLLESIGDWTWLINSITFGDLKIRLVRDRVKELIRVKGWGSLDVDVNIKIETLKSMINESDEVKKERAINEVLSFTGFNNLIIDRMSDPDKMRRITGEDTIKNMTLAEFLLLLRIKGYKGPIYLDTNVIMYGFHNEFFLHDIIVSLMGQRIYKNRLRIVAPHCVFYEVLRKYEESRKSTKKKEERCRGVGPIEFAISSISSMVAKHFEEDVGVLLSFCDPTLHEIIAKEDGILITADTGLFENIRSDSSVKGIAIHVNNYNENYKNVEMEIVRLVRSKLDFKDRYLQAIVKLASSLRRHAAITQTLALLSLISECLGCEGSEKMIVELEGERKTRVTISRSKAEVKVEQ